MVRPVAYVTGIKTIVATLVSAAVLATTFAKFSLSAPVKSGDVPPTGRHLLALGLCVGGILMVSDDEEFAGEIVETVFALTDQRLELIPGPNGLELRFPRDLSSEWESKTKHSYDPCTLRFATLLAGDLLQ